MKKLDEEIKEFQKEIENDKDILPSQKTYTHIKWLIWYGNRVDARIKQSEMMGLYPNRYRWKDRDYKYYGGETFPLYWNKIDIERFKKERGF